MPIRLNKKRHPDILRLLAQRQQSQATEPQRKSILPGVLDGLNAFGLCEKVRRGVPADWLCFGPKTVDDEGWIGVVIWYRPNGYHEYKTLTLYGVWASVDSNATHIIIGQRILNYNQQPFGIEAYMYRMKNGFEAYYGDDASPPDADNRDYQTVYTQETRLKIRQEIAHTLSIHWDSVSTS